MRPDIWSVCVCGFPSRCLLLFTITSGPNANKGANYDFRFVFTRGRVSGAWPCLCKSVLRGLGGHRLWGFQPSFLFTRGIFLRVHRWGSVRYKLVFVEHCGWSRQNNRFPGILHFLLQLQTNWELYKCLTKDRDANNSNILLHSSSNCYILAYLHNTHTVAKATSKDMQIIYLSQAKTPFTVCDNTHVMEMTNSSKSRHTEVFSAFTDLDYDRSYTPKPWQFYL